MLSFYLQIVEPTTAVALKIKTVEEEGDVVVLRCLQEDGAVHVVGVDVRPARALQVAVFLFVGSAAAWEKPPAPQSEHLSGTRTMPTVSKKPSDVISSRKAVHETFIGRDVRSGQIL